MEFLGNCEAHFHKALKNSVMTKIIMQTAAATFCVKHVAIAIDMKVVSVLALALR